MLERSRASNLPENIDADYLIYKSNWAERNIKALGVNMITQDKSTLSKTTLEKANNLIANYLEKNISQFDGKIKILEPFAGNGVATKLLYDRLSSCGFDECTIKSTDIQDLSEYISPNSHPVEFCIDSVETVEKYGEKYNILLMISPPPSQSISSEQNFTQSNKLFDEIGYGDYFAIKKWSELGELDKMDKKRHLIFIGELGGSDGSNGMYQYLLNSNSVWTLELREPIYTGEDLFGGNVEKELFIFKKK